MTCSRCGQINEQGASFCEACGFGLVQPQVPAPPAVAAPAPAPIVTPPVAVARPAKRKSLIALLAIVVVLVSAGGAYWLGLLGGDTLLDRLVETPLPAASYEGWRISAAPHKVEIDAPDPGEVGQVQVHLVRGNSVSGFSFTVFQTPAQARTSFDASAEYGPEIAKLQQKYTLPSGAPMSCFGASVCHSLAGRTVIFVQMDEGTVERMKMTVESLVAHVSQLDR